MQNSEAAGYPINAIWATLAGEYYHHKGSGVWQQFGAGVGSGGGGGGGIGFVSMIGVDRFTKTDDPVSPITILGIDRFVQE